MRIGVDLVDLRRIHVELATRVCSPFEQRELAQIVHPAAQLQFIGSRFAAKEALFKATQTLLDMSEVDVAHREDGSPYFVQFPEMSLSISHEQDYAIAFVINPH